MDLTKKRRPVMAKRSVVARTKPQPKPATTVNAFLAETSERISYHIVQAGQTVHRVALINKVSVPDLMRWNNLKDYTIEVGQKLLIRRRK